MKDQIDRLPDLPDDADYSMVKLKDPWGDDTKSTSGYFRVTYNHKDYRSRVANRRSALKGR